MLGFRIAVAAVVHLFRWTALKRNGDLLLELSCMANSKDQKTSPEQKSQNQSNDKQREQPGLKEQQDAARTTPESPGEPAGGE